jgi:hypothetical protein
MARPDPPSREPQLLRQSQLVGRWGRIFALVMLPVLIALAVVIAGGSTIDAQARIFIVAIIFLLMYLWGRLFSWTKKHRVAVGDSALAKDRRPPVLYLRSFGDDPLAAKRPGQVDGAWRTEEENLASLLSDIGPFVAIGRPGERLPTLGATRMYIRDDEWQDKVMHLMFTARLVILRCGDTGGLRWELRQAITTLRPQQLALLVPFNPQQYAEFREWAATELPKPLPPYPQGPKNRYGTLQGIIYFQSDWTPQFVRIRPNPLTSIVPRFAESALGTALEPVFQQLQVRARRARRVSRLAIAGLIGLVLVPVVPLLVTRLIQGY